MEVKINRGKLVAARYTQGLTVKALAKKSGISPQTIFSIERGERNTTPVTLVKLCKVLKINAGDVIIIRDNP